MRLLPRCDVPDCPNRATYEFGRRRYCHRHGNIRHDRGLPAFR